MKINRIDNTEKLNINSNGAKNVVKQILIGEKDGSNDIIMRLFTLVPGAHSPRHTHAHEHLVKIEKGKGVIYSKDGEREVSPGDVIYVEPNEEHQFMNPFDEEFAFICVIKNVE